MVKRTSCEARHYVVFSILLLLPVSQIQQCNMLLIFQHVITIFSYFSPSYLRSLFFFLSSSFFLPFMLFSFPLAFPCSCLLLFLSISSSSSSSSSSSFLMFYLSLSLSLILSADSLLLQVFLFHFSTEFFFTIFLHSLNFRSCFIY
jgi:hypothetical protein